MNAGNWPTPLGVYGYNSTYNLMGGDLFEAETLCLDSANMGQIASEVGNLSYYSTDRAPIVDANVVSRTRWSQSRTTPPRPTSRSWWAMETISGTS